MYSFSKAERLSGKKLTEQLFAQGQNFFLHPFKVVYLISDNPGNTIPNQILISVARRNFPKAVDRNRIKRSIREAYRLNKHILSQAAAESGKLYTMAFIYSGKQMSSFTDVQSKIILILQRLCKICSTEQTSGEAPTDLNSRK